MSIQDDSLATLPHPPDLPEVRPAAIGVVS
jgi:hypothetical protein